MQRKQLVNRVLIAIVVLLLGAALCLSSFPRTVYSWFEIERVEIVGEISHISASQFKRALGDSTQGTFFTVDVNAVREAARRAPWVKDAQVRRVWPNALSIKIEQHEALALWEDGRLVSTEGHLFAANPDEVENPMALPEFFGMSSKAKEVTRRYKRFTKMLEAVKFGARITEISVSERDSWAIAIAGEKIPPTRVELGVEREGWTLEDRLGVLIVQYPEVVKLMKGPPSSIDARYEWAFTATLPEQRLNKLRAQEAKRQAAEEVAKLNRL
jgi:cell division protein FtsQ